MKGFLFSDWLNLTPAAGPQLPVALGLPVIYDSIKTA
ncbi:hypothetical protein PLUA15_110015 [Pseudomonas lundensis]|jgi:hypothetical protein|uniref:Uncharacterized protein n=1 Tax=Pseudomonas lundensis TaxID=86185 RepID=A0AAX2H2Z6_9PSED|nr:hypothetical protein PLUA15_110015 [Pseudomonas lundensis]